MEDISFAAFSCVHAPLHDPEAIDWLVEQLAKFQPDCICHLGDGMEMAWASKHAETESIDADHEYAEHNKILAQIRKASPNSRRIFLPGNHEWRLNSPHIDSRVRSAMHWEKHQPEFEYWESPVKYENCRHKGVFKIGQVVFCHGFATSSSAVKKEACANTREYGLYIHGHTHRPTQPGPPERVMAGVSWPLNWWIANPGCLRDLAPDWMGKCDKTQWGQGVVLGRAQKMKSPRTRKCWESETRVFRTYDQWRER